MGKLIVIDGLDGSGKATQAAMLYKRITEAYPNKSVHQISFPDYSSDSSSLVRMYLSGKFGSDPEKLGAYACALFYTVDRTAQFLEKWNSVYADPNSVLICDRYLSANIIHQGGKLKTLDERKEFFRWVYDTETNRAGLPVEDVTIALKLSISTSQKLMQSRYSGDESKKDIHEADIAYLNKCYTTLSEAVDYLPTLGYNWIELNCDDGKGWIQSKEEIAYKIDKIIEKYTGIKLV